MKPLMSCDNCGSFYHVQAAVILDYICYECGGELSLACHDPDPDDNYETPVNEDMAARMKLHRVIYG
jgi:hypothetical protein